MDTTNFIPVIVRKLPEMISVLFLLSTRRKVNRSKCKWEFLLSASKMPAWIWIQNKVERISVRYWQMPVCVGMRTFRVFLSKAGRKNRKLSFILPFTIRWYIPISCKMSTGNTLLWRVMKYWLQMETVTLFSRFGIRTVTFTNSLRWFTPNVSYKWCVPCSICIANMVGYPSGNFTGVRR